MTMYVFDICCTEHDCSELCSLMRLSSLKCIQGDFFGLIEDNGDFLCLSLLCRPFVDSSAAERQEKRVSAASEEGPEDRQCHWRWKLLIQVHFEKASLFIDPVPIRSMEIRTSTSSFVVYGMIVGERKRNRKPSIT